MNDYDVTKYHINRLSGNHRQGDYKKTTEYLDAHTVNTVDLLLSERAVKKICEYEGFTDVNGAYAFTNIYFNQTDYIDKLQPLLDKVIGYTYTDRLEYPNIHYVSGFYSNIDNGFFKFQFQYCWDTVLKDCFYVFSEDNAYVSKLVTIGTGDLEIVVDDVRIIAV